MQHFVRISRGRAFSGHPQIHGSARAERRCLHDAHFLSVSGVCAGCCYPRLPALVHNALGSAALAIDNKRLTAAIESWPAIWQTKHCDHRNRYKKAVLWDEVVAAVLPGTTDGAQHHRLTNLWNDFNSTMVPLPKSVWQLALAMHLARVSCRCSPSPAPVSPCFESTPCYADGRQTRPKRCMWLRLNR